MVFDLANDDVTGHYWKGLNRLRTAFSYGEPLSKHPGVGPTIAGWLLERGLIESVDNPQYPGQTCYRITALGYAVLKRGQRAKPPRRPRLNMLEPRLKTLDTRVAKPPKDK
jgi:hypothetical protein